VLYYRNGRILVAPAERHHTGDGRWARLTPPLGIRGTRRSELFTKRRPPVRVLHAALFRPGGVHQDLPPALLDDIETMWSQKFPGRAFNVDVPAVTEKSDFQNHA